MRVAAYCRVSTADQATGVSLDVQEQHVRDRCEREGWDLAAVVREASTTRKYLPKRAELVSRTIAGDFDVLIVARLDRFGRNTIDTLQTIERVEQAGRRVMLLHPEIPDTSDPFGRAMLTMLAAGAQLERDLRGLRVREAIAARKAAGIYKGGARPQCERTDPEVVESVMRWHERGLAHREIAGMLTLQGFTPVRAKSWTIATISAIVREKCGTCARCRAFSARRRKAPVIPDGVAGPPSASGLQESWRTGYPSPD